MLYKNYYSCPKCGEDWEDVWDCMCDDRCPNPICRIPCTPIKSKKIKEGDHGFQSATRDYRKLRSL